jgi:hypothetical protein
MNPTAAATRFMLTLPQSPNRISRTAISLATALCVLLSVATAFEAQSVLISTGDGTGNTTPPSSDPGFDNVGSIGGLTGVYVGNGWVLTANHVGENPIVLLGVTYDPVPGSGVRFQNPNLSFADLKAYKLLGPDPPLPALVITDAAASQDTLITIIGNGRNRGVATTWSGHTGWDWGVGHAVRWGTNKILELNTLVFNTQSFSTGFDDLKRGQAKGQDEADLVTGDSGGAAFTGGGASAELIGILFARGTFTDQPANTSLFNDLGYVADLFAYRNDILAVIDQPDCDDGLDDDGDGLTDYPDDPGCSAAPDGDERGPIYECDNGIDDDGDGLIDFPDDDGCLHPTNPIEAPEPGLSTMLGVGVLALCTLRRRSTRRGTAQSSSSSSTR